MRDLYAVCTNPQVESDIFSFLVHKVQWKNREEDGHTLFPNLVDLDVEVSLLSCSFYHDDCYSLHRITNWSFIFCQRINIEIDDV